MQITTKLIHRFTFTSVLLFTICLLHPLTATAQWTNPDTSQNINNTNTGNVGIGTSSPTAKLEVNKNQNAGTAVTLDNGFTSASNAAFSGIWFKQVCNNLQNFATASLVSIKREFVYPMETSNLVSRNACSSERCGNPNAANRTAGESRSDQP